MFDFQTILFDEVQKQTHQNEQSFRKIVNIIFETQTISRFLFEHENISSKLDEFEIGIFFRRKFTTINSVRDGI